MSVAANASVVLVSSAGRTIKVTGPYRGAPDTSDSDAENRPHRVTGATNRNGYGASITKLAASRGGTKTAPAHRPDIWGIDVAHAGTYCLRPDRTVMLWWDAARSGAIVNISPAGNATLAACESVGQVANGTCPGRRSWRFLTVPTYVVRFRSNDTGEELVTIMMPNLDTDAHRAAWMSEHGCISQALGVLDAMATDALRPRP